MEWNRRYDDWLVGRGAFFGTMPKQLNDNSILCRLRHKRLITKCIKTEFCRSGARMTTFHVSGTSPSCNYRLTILVMTGQKTSVNSICY